MSITFKAHGGFDAPWFVIPDDAANLSTGGSSTLGLSDKSLAELQKAYIIEAFGLHGVEGILDKTLHEVAVVAEPLWSGSNTVAQLLGGVPATEEKAEPAPKAKASKPRASAAQKAPQEAVSAPLPASQPEPAPEVAPEPAEPAHPHQHVLDLIAQAETALAVKDIFADYKLAFKDATVAEAAKARIAELR